MDKPLAAVVVGPTNPVVTGGKVKYRISYCEKPYQTSIVTIANEKSKTSTIAMGNGD